MKRSVYVLSILICASFQSCNLVFPDERSTRGAESTIDVDVSTDAKMADRGLDQNRDFNDRRNDADLADLNGACGDGRINGGEVCDGILLEGRTCSDFLFERGDLHCDSQCRWDVSDCSTCGDGHISGKEQCEGAQLAGASCESTAINGVESFGVLGCDMRCDFDRTQCKTKFSSLSVDKRFPNEGEFYGHNCAIRTNGTIVCWGTKGGGLPVDPPPSGAFLSVSSGVSNNCAILENGTAKCWPEAIPPNLTNEIFSEISVGQNHACGLRKVEKTIVCWGNSTDGTGKTEVPVQNKLFKQVQVGSKHSCGLTLDGQILCWGYAGNRDGMGRIQQSDRRLESPSGSFESIAINFIGGCALDTLGRAQCWPTRAPSPPSNLAFEKVSVRVLSKNNNNGQGMGAYGCGILRNSGGRIKCWGVAAQNQFPDENEFYLDFGIADLHSCAIKQNQEIVCFGFGSGAKDTIPQ